MNTELRKQAKNDFEKTFFLILKKLWEIKESTEILN